MSIIHREELQTFNCDDNDKHLPIYQKRKMKEKKKNLNK